MEGPLYWAYHHSKRMLPPPLYTGEVNSEIIKHADDAVCCPSCLGLSSAQWLRILREWYRCCTSKCHFNPMMYRCLTSIKHLCFRIFTIMSTHGYSTSHIQTLSTSVEHKVAWRWRSGNVCRLDQLEAHSHKSAHVRREAYLNVVFLSSLAEAELGGVSCDWAAPV